MKAVNGESENLGGTEAQVLDTPQIYFLSSGAVVDLELGEIL